MKKIVIFLIIVLGLIIIAVLVNISNNQIKMNDILEFNAEFEKFNNEKLYGADILTIINKAIDNNDVYEIPKNDNGEYIDDRNLCSKN